MKNPQYLNQKISTDELSIGDFVYIQDGSYCLTLQIAGFRYDQVSIPGKKWNGTILATDCVLPADNTHHNNVKLNDCIVGCENR